MSVPLLPAREGSRANGATPAIPRCNEWGDDALGRVGRRGQARLGGDGVRIASPGQMLNRLSRLEKNRVIYSQRKFDRLGATPSRGRSQVIFAGCGLEVAVHRTTAVHSENGLRKVCESIQDWETRTASLGLPRVCWLYTGPTSQSSKSTWDK